MKQISYSAHISNKKSAITSKAKLAGVAKHNLRKYHSSDYSQENIVLIFGSGNLMKDVKQVYHEQLDEALREYNAKQTREDRKIEDYFSHVAEKKQDLAVEIIFQIGDKKNWEEHYFERKQINTVYKSMLEKLQELMSDFVVVNAVIHYDEAGPHMHVVGVPVGRNFKRGVTTKVSKRSVFTQETLSKVLQGKLRENAEIYVKWYLDAKLKEKQKGKNHDLTVMEYKVQKEKEKVEELDSMLEIQRKLNQDLCDEQAEIENENRGLYQMQEQL